ncbi:MAG: DUF4962 domain-containing protein [Gemmatimonadota bacterium]|nr:DUF4962 domain-containing protein [Gemmatimonadota bacterium]
MAFSIDTSPQPDRHPPITPADGSIAIQNPPALIWRADDRAAEYIVEISAGAGFEREVIRREGIDMPFYNPPVELERGTWYWRYFAVTSGGERSLPGPVRRFHVTPESVPLAVPPSERILDTMPDHPRIFVTPETLEAFRARRHGPGREAWRHLKHRADALVQSAPPDLNLQSVPEGLDERRGQVFHLRDGRLTFPAEFQISQLKRGADTVNALSFAYLISGDETYAAAARRWMAFISNFRVDSHQEDRGQHDTVVYCYEYGLKGMALAYDRLYDLLTPRERSTVLSHIVYHCEAAYKWIREGLQIHLNYQNSHGQQCMHALLTSVLAVATETAQTREWADYLIRQYANRVAWGSVDGGYTEGQKYGHKVQFILEALAALKTATGMDVFREPRWRNTGSFWLYCMSLNYWWNHWGDCYSLIDPNLGSDADSYVSAFLAAMTGDPAVKWWSDIRVCNPVHLPLQYLAGSGVRSRPPVDIPQARLFSAVGQLAAYDRFYDHGSSRIFFRSSPWGDHSHAHQDQNGFVIHTGGEILACDAGYYTYAGDVYHSQWSRTTQTHNSILVDGESQRRGIAHKGEITAFFNTPDACFFTGDASGAYGELLERFHRHILFIRPDVFVICDDLESPEPREYAWTLNTFERADMDEGSQSMTIPQRDQRLLVRHLAGGTLRYSQNNDRPFPLKTRDWCRVTEAFPQQWNIRVATEKRTSARLVAVLHAYSNAEGPRVDNIRRVEADGAVGVNFQSGNRSECVLFRNREGGFVEGAGIQTDGGVVNVCHTGDRLERWLLHGGARLSLNGEILLTADAECDAAANYDTRSAAAHVQVRRRTPVRLSLFLPRAPGSMFICPPERPGSARPIDFTWRDGRVVVDLDDAGESVLWIDPVTDLTATPEPLELTLADSEGRQTLELKTAIADNGDIIAFGELTPRVPGFYELVAEGTELLVQDRWDPDVSARGTGSVTGCLREGSEIFLRYPPDGRPEAHAHLKESHKGRLINLLCNGGFEAGIVDYPPRYWNVQHPRTHDTGWPAWRMEGGVAGGACLKFTRPTDPISLKSRPMRLRTTGRYRLRFKARGSATHAHVTVSGQQGTHIDVPVRPAEAWTEYRAELDVQPGYTTVSVAFDSGGEPDQVLWMDDMEFGYIG